MTWSVSRGLEGIAAFWPVRTRRTVMRLFLARLFLLVTMHLALCSLHWFAGLVCSALRPVWTRRPRRAGYWFFWEKTSVGFCIQRSAWFDSGKPWRFRICSWTWLLTGAGDGPDSADNCGVSAVRAALLCLCSQAVSAAAMVSARISGDGDLAASSFTVSCFLGSVAQGFD